jgi:hypothetical protein
MLFLFRYLLSSSFTVVGGSSLLFNLSLIFFTASFHYPFHIHSPNLLRAPLQPLACIFRHPSHWVGTAIGRCRRTRDCSVPTTAFVPSDRRRTYGMRLRGRLLPSYCLRHEVGRGPGPLPATPPLQGCLRSQADRSASCRSSPIHVDRTARAWVMLARDMWNTIE